MHTYLLMMHCTSLYDGGYFLFLAVNVLFKHCTTTKTAQTRQNCNDLKQRTKSWLCVADLICKLSVFALVGVWVEGAAAQVGLEVVEDDLVPRYDHPTHQTQESPVLDVDSTIWIYRERDCELCETLSELEKLR